MEKINLNNGISCDSIGLTNQCDSIGLKHFDDLRRY